MALRKPLFIDADGFPMEMNPTTDSLSVQDLIVSGTSGITLVSGTVSGLPLPTANDHAASKQYVDNIAQGLTPKQSVRVATTANLTATYVAGGGAGGTGQFTSAPTTLNGIVLVAGNRVLVKDQGGVAAHVQNGIYVVGSTTTVWDRASDFDENDEVLAGSTVFVSEGTAHRDTIWCVITDDNIVLNTTPIEWSQFSGASRITAGVGLSKTGDTLNVIGVPLNFNINSVATNSTVSAANLNELTSGASTTLHTHPVLPVSDPARVSNSYTVGASVAMGDPVYFSANGIVSKALTTTVSANKVIGVAKTAVASGLVEVVSSGRLNGVLTGATAGDYVYLAAAGGLTLTRPVATGVRVLLVGWAINATDLHVSPNFLGRNA